MLPLPPIPPWKQREQIGPPEDVGRQMNQQQFGTAPLGAGGGDILHPFQISDVSTDVDPLYYSVRYGTVNDIAPTSIATDIALTDDATNYIYLECTLDVDGEITDVDLLENTTGLPADDSTYAYKLLGTVVCVDGLVTTINQAVTHSLEFRACDRTNDGEEPPAVVDAGSYHFWGV